MLSSSWPRATTKSTRCSVTTRDEKRRLASEKGKHALRICHAWTVHAAIEQEIFYPAVAAVLGSEGDELLGEAVVEHESIRRLVLKVENTPADDRLFDPRIKVLAEYVAHHVKKEEGELFDRIRHSKLDLLGTGERMAARRTELSTTPAGRHVFRQARKVLGRK